MTSASIAYALVVGLLVALFAVATEGAAHQLRLPSRWGWVASMLLTVALTAIAASNALRAPSVDAAVGGASVASDAATNTTSLDMFATARDAATRIGSMIGAVVAEIARVMPVSMAKAIALLWVLATVTALVLIALVHLRVRLARRAWPAAELHGHRVRVAPATGPAVIGVIDPEIVVPRWLLLRAEHEQRLVLAHEQEHLRGGDHLALAAGCLAVALLPWHPALWWMLARLRLAIELDCDARVLRRGVSPSTYGATLIDLAGQCSGFRVGATALADEGSHLERRILAMKDMSHRRSIVRGGALCAAGSLALLVACQAKVPTAAQIGAMDVATAQHNAQMFTGGNVAIGKALFYVDGKQVDARAAHALTPNQIASVSVTHGSDASMPATIRISTSGEPASTAPANGLARLHSTLARIAGHTSPHEGTPTLGADDRIMSGLILLDGSVIDRAALAKVDPATLKSVEVIKGPLATKLYSEPAAANGVIKMTTMAH
jgi:beta-lactamase regulating signal transducer with metallopeptidase domain